jgi:DNA-binding MarR family transcriptional regulator
MTNPEFETALHRMLQITTLFNRDMEQHAAADGLTAARVPVVWLVSTNGPQTQRQLAEALGVSARNITGLVDILERDGFVTREPHPSDRRATLVTPTPKGAAIAERMAREQAEFTESLFSDWEPDAFAGFARGLDRIVDRLTDLFEGGDR